MDGEIVRKHVDQIRPRNVTYVPVSVDIFPKGNDEKQGEQTEVNFPHESNENTETDMLNDNSYPK